jgi:RND family efflux transporter MFP subunit
MRAENNVSRHFSVTREGINGRMIPRAIHRSLAPCFAALASLLFPATPGKQADAAEPAAPPVVVATAEQQEIAASQPFVGTVYPRRTSDVGSAVDGRLVEFPIEDGQNVSAGQPIAELLRGLLEIERTGAAAELEQRRQLLGELKAGTRPEEIAQARAVVAGFEARLEYARSRLKRLTRLVERGTSTTDELQDAQTEMRQFEAQLAGAKAALALAEAGPRAEQIAQAAAAVAAQEAELERIDDQLSKHTIRAPFDGWVVERFTEKGQWVARGGLIARIAELDRVEIEVQVPELLIGSLAAGATVRLEIDAAPNQTWIGTVERVVPQADLLSRSFPVKVKLENRIVDGQPVLRGGLLARAWLPVGKTGLAVVVPKDALVLGAGPPFVYAVETTAPGAGTVRPVPVTLGAAVGGAVEVRGDIATGQLVVVRGNERLRPGMAVSFAPPPSTP